MAYVTLGAYEALQLRASLNQTVPTALMRGGLIDVLEGRIQRLRVIPSARYMKDRCAEYAQLWMEDADADPS